MCYVRVIALEYILLWSDLNWGILCSYVNYIEQSLSAIFEMCIFGGVLSDINYEHLLMKLCKIIDRIKFEVGRIFGILKNFLKIFFFSKKCVILGFGCCLLYVYCGLVSLMYFWV